MLYAQLGLTDAIMNGTADEQAMLNYYNRTIEPIVGAITEAMARTFLTKTARSQKQSVIYLRDPFKLTPIANIAEIGDKFTRNEILSSNEMRAIIGFKPSSNPKADQLINSNMPAQAAPMGAPAGPLDPNAPPPATDPNASVQQADVMSEFLDGFSADVQSILGNLGG